MLADYGFVTILLSDDWNGADFLALPPHGGDGMNFATKYQGKELWFCFPDKGAWFLGKHDELKKLVFP